MFRQNTSSISITVLALSLIEQCREYPFDDSCKTEQQSPSSQYFFLERKKVESSMSARTVHQNDELNIYIFKDLSC